MMNRFTWSSKISNKERLNNSKCIMNTFISWFMDHYEKSRSSKPHYPATKAQKTTHIQLLCNYPPINTRYQ
jgi:hypothetical protein